MFNKNIPIKIIVTNTAHLRVDSTAASIPSRIFLTIKKTVEYMVELKTSALEFNGILELHSH